MDGENGLIAHGPRLALVCLFWLSGCADSTPARLDAGPPPEYDLGRWVRDNGPLEDLLRCDAGEACPDGWRCAVEALCLPLQPTGFRGTGPTSHQSIALCRTTLDGEPIQSTFNGQPCALRPRRVYDDDRRGVGLPLQRCLDLNDPSSETTAAIGDLFPDGCVWADGAPVTAEAPIVECRGVEPIELTSVPLDSRRLCGGTCGDEGRCFEFGPEHCIGRSDTRAFGICAMDPSPRCSADDTWSLQQCDGWFIDSYTGGTCACLVDRDVAVGPDEVAEGWVVPAESCRVYRDAFPTSVECRGVDFELLD